MKGRLCESFLGFRGRSNADDTGGCVLDPREFGELCLGVGFWDLEFRDLLLD